MMNKDVRKFNKNDLNDIIYYFSDEIKSKGIEIDIYFRIKRKKNGDFNGVEYKPKYKIDSIEKINPYKFRDDILNEISIKTKHDKNFIEEKFGSLLDKKYSEKIGIYIFNIIDNFGYHLDIYDYQNDLPFEQKYSDENDKNMIRTEKDRFIKNRILTHGIKSKLMENKYSYDKHVIFSKFYDPLNKISYFIYNKDFEFNTNLTNKEKKNEPWASKYLNSIKFEKLRQSILINVCKINLNIYDHFGNIHKYTEYHKLGKINFDE